MGTASLVVSMILCMPQHSAVHAAATKSTTIDCSVGSQALGADAASASRKYTSLDSDKTVKYVQEWRGGKGGDMIDEFLKTQDSSLLGDWAQTLTPYIVIPIVFFVLTCCEFTCLCCARCCRHICFRHTGTKGCCRKCCNRIGFVPAKNTSDYSNKRKVISFIVYCCLAAGCVISGMSGIGYLVSVAESVTDSVCVAEDFRYDSHKFFDSLFDPINTIISDSGAAIDNVSLAIGQLNLPSTEPITTKLTNLASDIESLDSAFPGFECAACTGIGKNLRDAADDVNQNVKPAKDNIESLKSSLQSSLVDSKSSIKSGSSTVQDSRKQIDDFVGDTWKGINENLWSQVVPVRDSIITFGSIFFSLTAVAAALTVLGVVASHFAKETNCTKNKCIDRLDDEAAACGVCLSWTLTLLLCIVLYILTAVLVPVGVATSDVCVVLHRIPKDFDGYLGSALGNRRRSLIATERSLSSGTTSAASILQGCFDGKTIFEAAGQSSVLNFSSQVNFDAAKINVTEVFENAALDSATASIEALTPESLGCSQPTCPFYNDMKTKTDGYRATIDSINDDMANMAQQMQSDIDIVINTAEASTESIFKAADKLLADSSCGFIGKWYYAFLGVLCGKFLASDMLLGLCCFICATFGIPMALTSLYLNMLTGGHGPGPEAPASEGDELSSAKEYVITATSATEEGGAAVYDPKQEVEMVATVDQEYTNQNQPEII